MIAEVARLLVEGGISLYRLQEVRASLESWFLEVTSRLEEDDDRPERSRRRSGRRLPAVRRAVHDRRGSPIPTWA